MNLFDQHHEDVQRADENADPDWKTEFYLCILSIACTQRRFTSQDVRNFYERDPRSVTHEPRAIGPMMLRAQAEGMIEATDEYRSTGSHGRPQRVWMSGPEVPRCQVGGSSWHCELPISHAGVHQGVGIPLESL